METKKKSNDHELAYKVLKITGLGILIVAVSVVAPTFPYLLLKAYLKKKFNQSYKTQQLRNAVGYLKRKKFIAYKNKKFILTKLGRKYLKHKAIVELKIKKVPWDHKWRLVTFDIPEEQTAARHILRVRLKTLGFYHFQRSVFIIPYPCEKEIEQLTDELKVSEFIHVLTTDRFRTDRELVKKLKP